MTTDVRETSSRETDPELVEEERGRKRWRPLVGNRAAVARFALPILLLVFVVFFSLAEPDTFADSGTAKTIISTQAVLAVLAL